MLASSSGYSSKTMRSPIRSPMGSPFLPYYSSALYFSSSSSSSSSTSSSSSSSSAHDLTREGGVEHPTEYEGCSSRPLGFPLPEDEHACSVSLPTWSAVVGYEEGDPEIVKSMKCGYPRFVYHPYVLRLMETILEQHSVGVGTTGTKQEDCLVLPSAAAAVRCQVFLQEALEGKRDGRDNAHLEGATLESSQSLSSSSSQLSRVRTLAVGAADIHAVLFPAETLAGMEAKAYWQHTGEVVSSRRAECAMETLGVCLKSQHVTQGPVCHSPYRGSSVPAEGPSASSQLRDRIATWAKVPDSDSVFLSPSGMSSIYVALRAARRYQLAQDPGGKGGGCIVFGFPYLDTLKMCSRAELCPAGVEFFGRGDETDLANLERMLESGRYKPSVLFTEVPSNPLLRCPDMIKLRALADKYNFFLVVDDTISNFLNANLLQSGLADAVCSSLTKLVSGRGDAMGGSLVANPHTEKGKWMQQDLRKWNDPNGGLFESDAVALLRNSVDFPERSARINIIAEGLADWLEEHPDVQTVYYPKSEPLYQQVQSGSGGGSSGGGGGGYGGLLSIVLHPHMCQRHFYDALDVAKGPSLGTNFTLCCPYTLLAHYHELDFAMTYDVPPNLLRVAVGMEPLEVLQTKFETAFSTSRLYPKPKRKLGTSTANANDVAAGAGAAAASQQTRSYSTSPWTVVGRQSPGQSQLRRSAQFALRTLVKLR
jgi:cystathionine gamma-synthase